MGMNIDQMRNAVIDGNIATNVAMIKVWELQSKALNEDFSEIISKIRQHNSSLEQLKR